MNTLNIFIKDAINNKDIETSLSLSELKKEFSDLSIDKESFLKMQMRDKTVIKFSSVKENLWIIDSPISLGKIHKQRYATERQCLILINEIYHETDIENLKGFIDVPIRHFTLDEMLEFKQEDEMRLKGIDPNIE